jgi:RNA polymerase sigma factor (sigma-70 family)
VQDMSPTGFCPTRKRVHLGRMWGHMALLMGSGTCHAPPMPHRRNESETPGHRGDGVELVREAYPRLLRLARLLARSPVEAEDLVQEAFVETLSRYPGFEGLTTPMGYLTTVLYRAASRRWRRSSREIPLDLQSRLEGPEVDRDAPAMIEQALIGLGPGQRACLLLRYLYGLDDAEIAAALGCSRSTVRSQIARGLTRARRKLGDEAI